MTKFFCDMCGVEIPQTSSYFSYATPTSSGNLTVNHTFQFCEAHATAVNSFIQTQKQESSG